jgi:hypothetical protein
MQVAILPRRHMLWTGNTAEAKAAMVPVASFLFGSVTVAVDRSWKKVGLDPGGKLAVIGREDSGGDPGDKQKKRIEGNEAKYNGYSSEEK